MFHFVSQFVTVEAVNTVVVDLFPVLRKGWNREIYTFFYCLASYAVGLTMVTNVRATCEKKTCARDLQYILGASFCYLTFS